MLFPGHGEGRSNPEIAQQSPRVEEMELGFTGGGKAVLMTK